MKPDTKFIFLILVLSSLTLISCATVPKGSLKLQQQSERMVPPEGMAGVYVFRPFLYGSGALVHWKAEIDSKRFGLLAPRTYLYGVVLPGWHSVGGEGTRAVKFNTKEGTNHYFKLSFSSGLVPIESDEARKLISEFTLSKYNIFENLKESVFGTTSTKSTGSLHEGIKAYKSGDYTRAHALWKPLAEQGDAQAQYNLGQLHAKGLGMPRNYTEAVKWYRMAAEQGDTHAQMTLSQMYSKGLGVAKDDLKAIEWHARAVEEGDTGAKFAFFLNLENIRKDAGNGDAQAQYKLGIMYSNGWGVTADFAEATKWYRKAAEQGHAASKEMLIPTFFAKGGICTNTKYKFEAKAPAGWDVNSTTPGDKSIKGSCEFMKKGSPLAPVISITIDFLRDYMLNDSLLNITKYMLKSSSSIELIEQPSEVKVNTIPASKTVYKMPGVKVMLYQFRKENLIITIQLMDRSSKFESNIEDFQETLNNFKFYQ